MDPSGQPAIVPLVAHDIQPSLPEARLSTVPLEVLLQITRNLKTPDYANFRLTDKDMEGKLQNAFAREYFTKRQFMLTEFSLQALVDISKSRFAGSLTHVILGLERPISAPAGYTHLVLLPNVLPDDYTTFINSGKDVEKLAEALANLPNLNTVGIRDFNSRTRFRDYPHIEWKSYGVRTYIQETGQQLETIQSHEINSGLYFMDKIKHINRVFLTMLRCLGTANARPTTFEVIFRRLSLHDHAFDLPDEHLSSISPVLENLGTLLLDLNSENMYPVDFNDPATQIPSYQLRKFLALTPNLEHLRLNFGRYNNKEGMKSLLAWLSSPVLPSTASLPNTALNVPSTTSIEPPTIDLPKLKQFEIGLLEIHSSVLLTIIKKFQSTIKAISFHKVCLLNPDTANPRKKVNIWANFFAELSRMDVELTEIKISSVTQGRSRRGGIIDNRTVIFKDSKNQHLRSWAGTNVKSALRDFRAQVAVSWLDGDKDESGSDPMTSEDENEYDDDDDNDEENEDNEDNEDDDDDEAVVSATTLTATT